MPELLPRPADTEDAADAVNKVDADTAVGMEAAPRRRLIGYWWAPLILVGVGLSIAAWLRPFQDLQLSDLPDGVVASTAALDKGFAQPVGENFSYATRRSYSSGKGLLDVEIRSSLQPLGHGLVMRQDDWIDTAGRTVVYQERFILFRNLFSVHTRSREVAPLVHDIRGRSGWYNDSAEAIASLQQGATPESPAWSLEVNMDRVSDIDGKSLTLDTARYKRRLRCERSGEVDGAVVGTGFTGSYPKISCQNSTADQPADRQERRSEYAWLPTHGIFLLLGYRQQADSADGTDTTVKGSYVSFSASPP